MGLTDEATVGERVAFYRRRRGMTQEVLSGLLGRSVDWLSKLERGVIELDRLSTIVAIADALGVEPVKLLPAAFTARRGELRDSVIGTAPGSVAAIKDAMFRDTAPPTQVPTVRIAGHRPSYFDHSECAEFDVRAAHEARESSNVELGAPRAVPAGVRSASGTESSQDVQE